MRWKYWRRYRYLFYIVAVAVVLTAGYRLLQPPAAKLPVPWGPAPQAPPVPSSPQPIPGEPLLDPAKYASEPMVSIWWAQKGERLTLPLETYLEGVVAQEAEPTWPVEALVAQAIAARTLTLHAMETGEIRRLHGTDVSTVKDELQAYAPEKVNDNVREAVRRSRGQVLVYGGSLINAIYSSCNGQMSATKDEAFPREIQTAPYFTAKADTCFEYAPPQEQTWQVDIPAAEVAAAVGYRGNPADIAILSRGPSGRILTIGAGDKQIYGAELRQRLGYDRLKSTLVTAMTYHDGVFTFQGHGWGNGVGLCQWGAYTYAQHGWTGQDIARYYYEGAEIKKLWP